MNLANAKTRIELFSDAVIAIVITIAALEIPIPHNGNYHQFIGSLFTFAISFFIVASYWSDHRNLFEKIEKINERVVFKNSCFLFSLVLIPVFTKWSMEAADKKIPALAFGLLLMIINGMFSSLFLTGSSLVEQNDGRIGELKKLYVRRDLVYYFSICLLMITAFFVPQITLFFFIGVPIISYVLKTNFAEKFDGKRRSESRKNQQLRRYRQKKMSV